MLNCDIYTSKKGIYKDLYLAFASDKTQEKLKEKEKQERSRKGIYKDLYATLQTQSQKVNEQQKLRKGIYKDLYREIDSDKKNKNDKHKDWHSYPLKAMAYSNDAGEALRPIIGSILAKLSWLPAILYAFLAIFSKCKSENESTDKKNEIIKEVLFQFFASMSLPVILVKSVQKMTNIFIDKISITAKNKIKSRLKPHITLNKLLSKFENKTVSGHRNVCVSFIGFSTLALAVKPIDYFVLNSINKYYNNKGS